MQEDKKTSEKNDQKDFGDTQRQTAGTKTCLLVLGMHRSGTSALTRVLNLMGYSLPNRLMGAGNGNETGHWEPIDITLYNDRLLEDLTSSWNDFRSLSMSHLEPQALRDAQRQISELIEQDYDNAQRIILKDPRICRMMPTYRAILEDAGYRVVPIIAFRCPLEVMNSLRKRRINWPEGFVETQAALLWLRHVTDAEYHSRGLARGFSEYSALLSDWRGVVKQLSKQGAFDLPNPICDIAPCVDDFIRPDLNHNAQTEDAVLNHPSIQGWCQTAYDALRMLVSNPDSKPAMASLDAVRENFNAAEAALFDLSQRSAQKIETLATATQHYEDVLTQLAQSTQALNAEQAKTVQLTRQLQEAHTAFTAQQQEFLSSRSWRLTAPWRWLGKTFRLCAKILRGRLP